MKVSLPKKLHVKQGDTVMVISGKDAGKVGKVQSALPREGKICLLYTSSGRLPGTDPGNFHGPCPLIGRRA